MGWLKIKNPKQTKKTNRRSKKTGGGPSSAKPLSWLEEKIAKVSNLDLGVNGCIGAVDLGNNAANNPLINVTQLRRKKLEMQNLVTSLRRESDHCCTYNPFFYRFALEGLTLPFYKFS